MDIKPMSTNILEVNFWLTYNLTHNLLTYPNLIRCTFTLVFQKYDVVLN